MSNSFYFAKNILPITYFHTVFAAIDMSNHKYKVDVWLFFKLY